MLHDKVDDKTYPFRIESLSDEEMTKKFDIMYIWEVDDTVLAETGSPIAFAQDLSAYNTVKWINAMPGLKKVNVALFGDLDQFPRIVKQVDGVYPIARPRNDYKPGDLLGFVGATPIRFHSGDTDEKDRTPFGQTGQCVEFANHYLVQEQGFKNLTYNGGADSYFYTAVLKDLKAFANGGTEKPQIGDLIVFDTDSLGEDPGHVAVISEVRDNEVCIAQQNAHPWHTCVRMENSMQTWHVEPSDKKPCLGWSRITSKVKEIAIVAPTPIPAPAVETTRIIKMQKVARGLRNNTVSAVVARTPGANLKASFVCNDWDFSTEATHKIYVGQVWKVCAWSSDKKITDN